MTGTAVTDGPLAGTKGLTGKGSAGRVTGAPMRRTLVLVTAAVTSMVALAFVLPLAVTVRQVARERALQDAERQATALAPVLEVAASLEVTTSDRTQIERAVAALPAGRSGRMTIWLDNGTTLGPQRNPPVDQRLVASQHRPLVVPAVDGVLLLQPIALTGSRLVLVEVNVLAAELTHGVGSAWTVLAVIAVGLVLVSVAVADRLAARTVRAAKELATAARQLGAGDLAERVSPAGPTELVEVGQAFNAMADRVVALLATERELLADLSHRLRTPLTALRLDAESIGFSPAAQRVRQAAGQLEGEIDGIIQAARSPADADVERRCDAMEVIRTRMRFWSALATDQQRSCEVVEVDGPLPVPLPQANLVAVIDALVGNVFRYTPPGCGFRVALRPVEDGTCLVVEDAGPGIRNPAAAVRRGASGAGSTGLGLDIARRAAESTGGAIRISRGSLGGARVWLRFGPVPAEPGEAGGCGSHRRLLPAIRPRYQRLAHRASGEST